MKLAKHSMALSLMALSLMAFTVLGVMGCGSVKTHEHTHHSDTVHSHHHQNMTRRGSGVVSGYSFDEYKLNVRAGEVITSYIDTDKLDVIVFAPESAILQNSQPYIAKQTGEYTLRVLLPRAFARRAGSYPYKLTVTTTQR